MKSRHAPGEKPSEQPSQIRLFFARHGETPGVKDAQGKDISIPDIERRVSSDSKADAIKKGQSKKLNVELMRVETSPRIRTSESVLRQAYSNYPEMVNPEAEVSDIQQGIDEVRRSLGKDQDYIPTGRLLKQRHTINPDLNFNYESHPEYNKQLLSHYKVTKDVLPFLRNESDGLVLDLSAKAKSSEEKAQIRKLTPYSIMIGNLVRIMQNYLEKSSKLVAAHQNSASKDPIQIDRFFGTHSLNLECLILKLMEMKFGKEYAEEYMNRKGHQNGFIDYHDGVEVDINVDSQESPEVVTLKFGDLNFELTAGELKKIVEEADKYTEEVEKRLEKNK